MLLNPHILDTCRDHKRDPEGAFGAHKVLICSSPFILHLRRNTSYSILDMATLQS
ncbi:hypothetical protein E8E14_013718 [Neopestalotiopsis sp. 37M]|nr:hypothetical protein E8E14_013718 [Neopestalotiopsis sp. 37M]